MSAGDAPDDAAASSWLSCWSGRSNGAVREEEEEAMPSTGGLLLLFGLAMVFRLIWQEKFLSRKKKNSWSN